MARLMALLVTSALALLAVSAPEARARRSAMDETAQLENPRELARPRPPESGALAQALDHLDVAIADARTTSGDAFRAFATLGIRTFDPVLGRVKSAREVLYEMAERFAAMRDTAQKADLARVMLGPGGAALMPYLNKGPAGVKELEALQPDAR